MEVFEGLGLLADNGVVSFRFKVLLFSVSISWLIPVIEGDSESLVPSRNTWVTVVSHGTMSISAVSHGT